MELRITMNTGRKDEVYQMAEDTHNQLAGSKEYVDNNVILNFDQPANPPGTVTINFDADTCSKEYIRRHATEMIERFLREV